MGFLKKLFGKRLLVAIVTVGGTLLNAPDALNSMGVSPKAQLNLVAGAALVTKVLDELKKK